MEFIQSELIPYLYRKRDSNSQNTDPKSAAYTIPPFLHFVWEAGFEPATSRVQGG